MVKNYYTYDSAIGEISIACENGFITNLTIGRATFGGDFKKTPLLDIASKQINDYLSRKRKIFELPVLLNGTDFQKRVWQNLINIPYGTTCSYKQLAISIGQEKAFRAVGMANNKNPIPIIVPCHRVIGSNGQLVGFAFGLKLKEKLLEIEKIN